MPESTPATEKSHSMSFRAAAVAVTLVGALFVGIFLATTLPGKIGNWRSALPTTKMTAEEAAAAYYRAKFLHEAEVRPKLIEAGWGDSKDIKNRRDSYYRDDTSQSQNMTDALFAMRAFPEIHDAFLGILLDQRLPRQERSLRFYQFGGLLDSIAEAIAQGDKADRHNDYRAYEYGRYSRSAEKIRGWFAFYNADSRLRGYRKDFDRYGHRKERETGEKDVTRIAAAYSEKLSLARNVLPMILADITRETDAQMALAQQEREAAKSLEKGVKPPRSKAWGGRERHQHIDQIADGMYRASRVMWKQRANAAFLPMVKEMLASSEGTMEKRYEAVPLIAEKPGLPVSEYFYWAKYKDDLDSVTCCVGPTPRHYAYLIGGCSNLSSVVMKQMRASGTLVLGGESGPGVTVTRVKTLHPEQSTQGNIYLLIDMPLALKDAPAYDLTRAHPIFAGMPHRYMESQPLVLPLNPANAKDKALIDWYAQGGWKAGRALLFSAVGSPADVARQWGSVHMAWWPNKKPDSEPDFAYLHMTSGHFMLGILPHLRGKGVTRFLGPVTALWFGRLNVDKNGWVDELYEARPEAKPVMATRKAVGSSPILNWFRKDAKPAEKAIGSEYGPAILFGKEIRSAQNETYGLNYRIVLAQWMEKHHPDPSVSPMSLYSFINNAVNRLRDWNMANGKDQSPAIEYLWRFKNDPEAEKLIVDILSQKNLRPYDRLRKVRRALGQPVIKGAPSCY